MTRGRTSVAHRPQTRVVGVIASRADLGLAIKMRQAPDLFELRLDQLVGDVDQLEKNISRLRRPLIITARHPNEGGANKLSLRQRRDLLTQFLPYARYIDVELRSAHALNSLLASARQDKVRRIISLHNFKSTPNSQTLWSKALAAEAHGASIFKVATRTDTPLQLACLLSLVANKNLNLPVSAMGIGKLGAISRVLLARAGSVLVYGALRTKSDIEGQLSLEQLHALGIGCRHEPLKG